MAPRLVWGATDSPKTGSVSHGGGSISLTRSPFPTGRIYFIDLAGAALGCVASVLLLSLIDAPSAIFAISAVLFISAAAYGTYAGELTIRRRSLYGATAYFVATGLGFMLVKMAMMQQLSILLGHPVYSKVVVLGGLILSAGAGSFVSDRWPLTTSWQSRVPALIAAASLVAYSLAVLPVMHAFTADLLWQRVLICLALVSPCGFILGFCFPVGMRWLNILSQGRNLPWMWALNGAAGTLGSFIAIQVSMDLSIAVCVLRGSGCYLIADLPYPRRQRELRRSISGILRIFDFNASISNLVRRTTSSDMLMVITRSPLPCLK